MKKSTVQSSLDPHHILQPIFLPPPLKILLRARGDGADEEKRTSAPQLVAVQVQVAQQVGAEDFGQVPAADVGQVAVAQAQAHNRLSGIGHLFIFVVFYKKKEV